jgi:hypothetical protein
MLKLSPPKKSKLFVLKENSKFDEIFENISFVKMDSSKSINYLTNMCLSGQGTTIFAQLKCHSNFIVDQNIFPKNTIKINRLVIRI